MVIQVVDGVIKSFVPDAVRPLEKYYLASYVAQCVETSQEGVEIGWVMGTDGLFAPPAPEEVVPTAEDNLLEMAVDHELRLAMLELGVV